MTHTFQVAGESGLYTAIETPSAIETMNHDRTGREVMRGNSLFSLTNGDPLSLNDDGTFTNISTREILRRA